MPDNEPLILEFEGREFEFSHYGTLDWHDDAAFLDAGTKRLHRPGRNGVPDARAIFIPRIKQYKFGGVLWEETGEVRAIKDDEVGVMHHGSSVGLYSGPLALPYNILRAVKILDQEG